MVGTERRSEIIYSLLDELLRLQRQRPMSGAGQSMISSKAVAPYRADRAARLCRGGEKIGDVSRGCKLSQQDILMHRIIEARALRKNENVDAMRGIDDAMANILTAF
jgi:hypothetical protein